MTATTAAAARRVLAPLRNLRRSVDRVMFTATRSRQEVSRDVDDTPHPRAPELAALATTAKPVAAADDRPLIDRHILAASHVVIEDGLPRCTRVRVHRTDGRTDGRTASRSRFRQFAERVFSTHPGVHRQKPI